MKTDGTVTSRKAAAATPSHHSKTLLDRHAQATIALNQTLRQNATDLYKVPLKRVNCSFDVVNVAAETQSLREIVRQQARQNRADLVICYAIRQPGCVSCREKALQLVELAALDRRVHLMGIFKGTGDTNNHCEHDNNDNEVLLEFYQDYFGRHTLYRDDKWKIYQAMGNKRLSLRQALVGFFRSRRRYRERNITMGTKKKTTTQQQQQQPAGGGGSGDS